MVPVYVKTVYSFMTSLITIDELISFAKENNYQTLTICDDNMYGVLEFIKKCQLNSIKPVVGLDIGISLLYAKNYEGYQNLMKLSTIMTEHDLSIDDLSLYSNGVICFIDCQSELLDKLKNLYKDYYIYTTNIDNKDFLYLHKTLVLKKEDVKTLYYLHLLRDGKKISDEYKFDSECYFIDFEDNRYRGFLDECNLVLPKYGLNLPLFCEYNDTLGLNSDEYLENLSIIGLNKRMNGKVTVKYKDRLLNELDVIKKMGFSNYFLIVYDYIKYAKSHDILTGPGRGSAAGSLVSYSLGITEVDPIKYDLLFERFLNSERVTMPDIDTDFPDDRRDDVIDYVEEKYGKERVSLITTFNTFGSKMALRDMGRVMNVPTYSIDDLCKKIGDKTLREGLELDNIKSIIESDNKMKTLYQVAMRIEGLPRNSSIHAAGVIISNTPLREIIPLVYNGDRYLSAYEHCYLEELGLLKMDFLGLRNLNIIDSALKMINKYKKINLKFSDIPLEDDLTNKVFCEGNTLGIFQFEKSGMREFLVRLKPSSFEDICNASAFYRPGPSMNIDLFLKRRFKKEKIDYFDNRLEPILKSTCGIIVYQEQIMQIASVMANFTLGEADILRRAMSKKKKEEIEKFREKFINNSIKNGYDKEMVLKIFETILNFASYGFNKSHSVAYGMISYRMAYLKAHYPLYFYLSLLDNALMDEEKVILYIKEMRKRDIKVLKPDVNKSMNSFTIYYDSIILPFSIIKGIGYDISSKIINARGDGFQDIYDFYAKMVKNSVSKNIFELLVKAGALDSFGFNRQTLFQNIDNLINYGTLIKNLGEEFVLKPELTMFDEYEREVLISNEKESFGFYLNNHPVSFYKNKLKSIDLVDLPKYFNHHVDVIVMIEGIKELITKKGDRMAFLYCSDEETYCDVTIFPNTYNTLPKLQKGDIIKIDGKVERRRNYEIIAYGIMNVKELI